MAGHPHSTCTPSRRTGRRGPLISAAPAVVALAVATALTLTGCPSGVDWSDYEGTNLIAARPFGATDDAGDALWYFADGLLAGTTDPVSGETAAIDYVVFEEVDSAVYGSLPADAVGPVYRLEVRNLLPNGDFENGTLDTGASWVEADINTDAPVYVSNAALAGTAIAGSHSLSLDFGSSDVYYALDLSSALLDGFPADATYAFRYLVNSNRESFSMEQNNASGPGDASNSDTNNRFRISISSILTNQTLEVPIAGSADEAPTITPRNEILADPSFPYFSFGGYFTQGASVGGTIDNIRIVRSDKNYFLRLPVPFGDADRPNLNANGSYTVSVWIKEDTGSNRFVPSHIALGLDSVPDGTGGETALPVAVPDDVSSWQELSASFNGFPFDTVGTATDTVILEVLIEIGHSVGGANYIQPGSLLMTDPFLEWSPSGV